FSSLRRRLLHQSNGVSASSDLSAVNCSPPSLGKMSNNGQPQFVQQGNQQVSIDIQRLNPDQDEGLKRWYRDFKNLGSLGLKLIMPLASTVLAASGVAVISLS
ncbi:unnamed protein product, partial [Arabidopsis halleri]